MIKRELTRIHARTTILLVGQTQAGSAEVQPARDNQPKATNGRWGGRNDRPPHLILRSHFELCDALKNLLAEGKESLLSVKWFCPFHAAPIHLGHLGHPVNERNYQQYVEQWQQLYAENKAVIGAVCENLHEVWQYARDANEQAIREVAKDAWFKKRVFDMYLWNVGKEA